MAYITNDSIIPAANRGETVSNPGGTFSTVSQVPYFGGEGYLPKRVRDIFHARKRFISQVVYSYATPIAWKDNGVWIIPDVTYSATTSCKHATHLYRLNGPKRYIPWDESLEVYERIVDGHMIYNRPNTRKQYGTYAPTN